MAKFHGKVGIATTTESSPGVHTEVIVEVDCNGDILREARGYSKGESVNENLRLSNRFSIVYNDVTLRNLQFIRYVLYLGEKWIVTDIEVASPRLILTTGGIYNGN